jgi:hypothetical protein
MALRDIRPDRIRFGGREKIQVDRVPRRRDRGQDVVAVHPFPTGHAQRGDCERVEPGCEQANRSVVAKMFVHKVASEVADRSTPAGRRLLLADANSAYKFMKKDSSPSAIFRDEHMRRFSAALVAVAVAASTAGAAHGAVAKTSGGVALQLADGAGLAKVRSSGTFIGRVRRGKIVATSNVDVNGCESRGEAEGNMIRCKGRGITFSTLGAERWRLRLRGRGISGSGFVHGCLVLDARDSGSTGTFRRGLETDPQPWPRSSTRYRLGTGTC